VIPDWVAPPHWRAIDFVSDLHLAPGLPRTAAAFGAYLAGTTADAVCLLGDVFEAWVGDDMRQQPFEQGVVAAIAAAARRISIGFMPGNRDFLVGAELCAAAGMTALADPSCLHAFGQRWLLVHGDAQCLGDAPYQAFRAQVRSPAWQRDFLARPLAERLATARAMRERSRAHQASGVETQGDLDAEACRALLLQAGAATLIHGHTHRPAAHELGDGLRRVVLSDWDLDDGARPRADVLRLSAAGLQRLTPAQATAGTGAGPAAGTGT